MVKLISFLLNGIDKSGFEYILAIGKISTIPAALILFIQRLTDWYLENESYIGWIFVVLVIDHAVGTYSHLVHLKDFSIEKNLTGLLTKIMVVIASYAVTEAIRDTLENINFIAEYLSVVIKVSILLYPAYPAMKNIDVISGGKSPFNWLIKAIEKFQNDGDLSHFATTKRNQNDFFEPEEEITNIEDIEDEEHF